ncbi:hypothetical protein C8Q74DRAFT_1220439 [Fomes fomentarius]|nr:hypothetical protein C8Q74DRAFT_1220439 [Fomes fomentarius]
MAQYLTLHLIAAKSKLEHRGELQNAQHHEDSNTQLQQLITTVETSHATAPYKLKMLLYYSNLTSNNRLLKDAAKRVHPLEAPFEILSVIRRGGYVAPIMVMLCYDVPLYGEVIGPALGNYLSTSYSSRADMTENIPWKIKEKVHGTVGHTLVWTYW